jgi:hypothetical protein
MKRFKLWTLICVALGTAICLAQTKTQRDILLELTLPNGAHPQLKVADGGTGSVELPGVGKFGFVPAIKDAEGRVVTVEVVDLSAVPPRRLTRIEVIRRGNEVQTDTNPKFGVSVTRIITR